MSGEAYRRITCPISTCEPSSTIGTSYLNSRLRDKSADRLLDLPLIAIGMGILMNERKMF